MFATVVRSYIRRFESKRRSHCERHASFHSWLRYQSVQCWIFRWSSSIWYWSKASPSDATRGVSLLVKEISIEHQKLYTNLKNYSPCLNFLMRMCEENDLDWFGEDEARIDRIVVSLLLANGKQKRNNNPINTWSALFHQISRSFRTIRDEVHITSCWWFVWVPFPSSSTTTAFPNHSKLLWTGLFGLGRPCV